MRQKLFWYVFITISFKIWRRKERKEVKRERERKGGGGEMKLMEFLRLLMTLKGGVTWNLMVCPQMAWLVPQRVHIAGFANRKTILWGGLWVRKVTHLQDSCTTKAASALGHGLSGDWAGPDRWSFLQTSRVPHLSPGKSA